MRTNLEELSKWYGQTELDFDRELIVYRYQEIQKYFLGESCLEIAPAQGVMTQFLVNDFKFLDIVEGSKNLLDKIPSYPNTRKFHSFIEDFKSEIEYDTIIMDHILEHIADPIEVLTSVYHLLKKGGRLIIGVPNALSFHRLLGVELGYLSNPYELNERDRILGHYRVYDLELLNKDLRQSGFNILANDGVFFKLLSNMQIEKTFSQEMRQGCFKLGRKFQSNCAEIYAIATK